MKKIGIIGLVTLGVLLTGCTANRNELPPENRNSNSTTSKSSEAAESSQTSEAPENTTEATSGASVQTGSALEGIERSAEEAIKAYQEAYPDTSVTSLELDTSFGSYYYEVKGMDDNAEYEVKINAKTGELAKEKEERLDADEQNGVERKSEELSLEGILSIDEAAAAALKAVGQGEAIEWSLEREMSTTYWEVKVVNGRSEASVKLDAKTGAILETEMDD
ncbi:PepSY domain-containing protein [Enterococcus sp. LJL51]|uniref:PepSY domain-containing protein n=1 Tax=Enterococcus sp. LJL51 TaxID=3416656 RepID=UPI003CF9E699